MASIESENPDFFRTYRRAVECIKTDPVIGNLAIFGLRHQLLEGGMPDSLVDVLFMEADAELVLGEVNDQHDK